jgi:hypothetical protein
VPASRSADGRSLGVKAAVVVTIPIAIVVAVAPALYAFSQHQDAVAAVLWFGSLSLAGMVAATCAGALFGPRLVRDPVAFRSGSILGMSGLAVVIGAYAFGAGLAVMVGVAVGPDPMALAWIPVGGTMGLAVFGLPALVIVVPHAIAWRRLMRRWIDG